jgi:hypothetical protein
MARALLALLLLVAGSPGAAARDAVSAVDACIRQLDPGLDVGYQRVAARCPDLAAALAASPWAAQLPRDWTQNGNELSAAGLAELRTLIRREVGNTAAPPSLRLERVGPLIASLTRAEPPKLTWWARFKRWLREVLTPHPRADDPGWLRRLFGDLSLSGGVLEVVAWATLVLVVLLAAAIVVNELRLAGLLGLRRAPIPAGGRAAAAREAAAAQELEQADAHQQPRLLLELIAAQLARQDRLPQARALTVHELARAARLPDAPDRARLEALGAACELVRYSDRELPAQALAAALAQGRELLAALQAPGPRVQVA